MVLMCSKTLLAPMGHIHRESWFCQTRRCMGLPRGAAVTVNGTVFKVNTDGSEFTVLKNFIGSDGYFP